MQVKESDNLDSEYDSGRELLTQSHYQQPKKRELKNHAESDKNDQLATSAGTRSGQGNAKVCWLKSHLDALQTKVMSSMEVDLADNVEHGLEKRLNKATHLGDLVKGKIQ